MADACAQECRSAGAVFIVNDRADVAALAGASGVHVGQDDLAPEQARALLPDAPWIGLSTHGDAQFARGLTSAATYLAVGPVFNDHKGEAGRDDWVGGRAAPDGDGAFT